MRRQMPALSPAAIRQPGGYIVALKEALMLLSSGADKARVQFGSDASLYTANDIGSLRAEIRRIENLVAIGQLGPPRRDPDAMPAWLLR